MSLAGDLPPNYVPHVKLEVKDLFLLGEGEGLLFRSLRSMSSV